MTEALLARARTGDDRAFRDLVEPYRPELRLHCYRILGSLTDAEDMVQETLLAAWTGLSGFQARAALRTWLYRIATNRCLNAVRDRARRAPTPPVPPFQPPEPTRRAEATWLQPFPDTLLDQVPDPAPGPEARYHQREAVELAFVAGLARLPPRQAATLILRDVLGYSTAEVADLLDTTETAVKGALQRARATLARYRETGPPPGTRAGTRPGTPPGTPPGPAPERDLVRRFADAFTGNDIDALVALLTDDAWLAMPPAPHEYLGIPAIVGFLRASGGWRGRRRLVLVPTRANTQPAFGCYLAEPDGAPALPAGLLVVTVAGDRIRGLTRFLDNRLFAPFGLPDRWVGR
jgi:RNA polymerase sigma-70 factor (TIGR02960 family)